MNSLSDGLRLDLFFTICLQKKVVHDLNNPNLDIKGLKNIYSYVNQFMRQTIKGNGVILEHEEVIKKIQEMVDLKKEKMRKEHEKKKDELDLMLEESNVTQANIYETKLGDYK